MKRRILLIVLLLAPCLPLQAATILIVGDSLSAAYGMAVDEGWVSLLDKRLARGRYPYAVVNASISGDTTAGARARLPQALDRHQPSIVVLEIGGNDGLRGLSLDAMKRNLAEMIALARRHRARVLLLGIHLPPNYGERYTQAFHAVYHQLAAEHGVALVASLVDEVGRQSTLMQADGIHPNGHAQPMIVERVWSGLLPLLDAGPVRSDRQPSADLQNDHETDGHDNGEHGK